MSFPVNCRAPLLALALGTVKAAIMCVRRLAINSIPR